MAKKKRVKKSSRRKVYKPETRKVNGKKITMVASLLISGIGLGMILSNINITGNVVSNSITNFGWVGPILLIAGLIGFFVANQESSLEKYLEGKSAEKRAHTIFRILEDKAERRFGEFDEKFKEDVSEELVVEAMRYYFNNEQYIAAGTLGDLAVTQKVVVSGRPSGNKTMFGGADIRAQFNHLWRYAKAYENSPPKKIKR